MRRAAKLYTSGMTTAEVAAAMNINLSAARKEILSSGIKLRTHNEAMAIASSKGRFANRRNRKGTKHSDKSKELIRKARLAHGEINASGRTVKPSGYVEYTRGIHKGRSVHVVAMEKEIGRALRRDECVHHKNEDRSDNRLENLQLMTRAEHASLHAKENLARRIRNNKGQFT